MTTTAAAQALTTGLIVLATFASVASSRLYSQEQQTTQRNETQAGAQEPSRTAKATRVERAPGLDGTLDDPEWQSATPISGLVQMDTANAQAASANIRLRWNYRPDSDLFFIYTAGQRFASLVAANPPQYYENRFAFKFTYSRRP
jgi:hypothetical protein